MRLHVSVRASSAPKAAVVFVVQPLLGLLHGSFVHISAIIPIICIQIDHDIRILSVLVLEFEFLEPALPMMSSPRATISTSGTR